MGSDFTAADQAFLLIDIVLTLAALLVWAFWRIANRKANLRPRRSPEVGVARD